LSGIYVRKYRQEDLEKVYSLFRSRLGSYVHFYRDKRIIEHFTQFPSAKRAVYVAISKEKRSLLSGEVVGFLVVGISESKEYAQGLVAELCSVDEEVTRRLIKKAINYCIQEGADIIAVTSFPDEKEGVFSRAEGWFRANPYLLLGAVASPIQVLRVLLESKLESVRSFVNGILFVLDDNTIHVKSKDGSVLVNVVEGNSASADISVEMSNQVFSKIIMGATNPYMMYLRRRIKIRKLTSNSRLFQGLSCKYKILKLCASLRIPRTFHVAIIDAL